MKRLMCWLAVLMPSAVLLADEAKSRTADSKTPGYEGQTAEVVERALAAYREATSYRDKLAFSSKLETQGNNTPLPEDRFEVTLAWAKDKRLALETPHFAVFADGKTLTEYIKDLYQYIVRKDFETVQAGDWRLSEYFPEEPHPVLAVLGRKSSSPPDLFGQVQKFSGVKAASRDGKSGKQVSGVVELELPNGEAVPVPFDAWFSDETGLLGEIRYDDTMRRRRMLVLARVPEDQLKLKSSRRRYTFSEIELGQKIPADAFAFEAPKYVRKVPSFELPRSEEEFQRILIGKPAPDFSGTDLSGKPISLERLKGRVILLDFWASWCGPCLMAMPTMQQLSEKFADKPVSIVGVNGDGLESKDSVKAILKRAKVTYRQFIDEGDKTFAAYRVSPIPCVVLIGKDGKVQAIHTGFGPGEGQRLAAEIEKLLRGENLFASR